MAEFYTNRKIGLGIGGYCCCPKCKIKIPHRTGYPCNLMKCPVCNKYMARLISSKS